MATKQARGGDDPTSQAATAYLRAQFFARRLREFGFFDIAAEVQKLLLIRDSFPWSKCDRFGVSQPALRAVQEADIEPLLFFLHPRVLDEQPSLLLYYRCVALLSQKGLHALAGTSVAGIESGKAARVPRAKAKQIILAVNGALSLLAETVEPLERRYLDIFLYATAGAQVQGSWANAIGTQGEILIKEIVIGSLWDEVTQIVWKNDSSDTPETITKDEALRRAGDVKVIRLAHGFHCLFASEPDMSFRSADGKPLLAIEVKAGTDPAGALERYGAAIKSFSNEKAINPRVKTVYVASCLTPEVRSRIDEENPFDYTYLVSELLRKKKSRQKLVGLMLRHLAAAERG